MGMNEPRALHVTEGQGKKLWVADELMAFKASGKDTGGAYALTDSVVPPGAADREVAAELREALRGRRAALDRGVEGMDGALRPGLDPARAAAVLRALCRAEVFRELVEESGWSPDEYAAWLFETLKEQLLPSATPYP